MTNNDNTETKTGELEPFPADKPIAVYNEFRSQLAELERLNNTIIFDYRDAKGNKEARSHVYTLRRTKTAIDGARKKENAAAVAYKKRVDTEAEELVKKLEEMIDVHQKPLDEIEAAEASRLEYIKSIITAIESAGESISVLPSAAVAQRLAEIEKVVIDDSFAEFLGDAAKAHDLSLLRLRAQLPETQKREAEAKELDDLRKMRAEKEAKEKADQLAKDAEDRRLAEENARQAAATKQAQEKAAAEEIARLQAEDRAKEAEEREQAAKAANAKRITEMAAQAKKDAEEAAARAKKQAEAEQAAKEKAAAEELAKREANKKHVAKIHSEIAADLTNAGIFNFNCDSDDENKQADLLCETISQGKIRHLSIKY